MSPFALLGPFQSRNNLFQTFFGIFFKIFVLWGPLDAHRLEFRENPTVLEFNEI